MTIAANLKDMFKSIVAVGSDIDYRSGLRTGSILIEEMTIAGS
jgi:PmbA protein